MFASDFQFRIKGKLVYAKHNLPPLEEKKVAKYAVKQEVSGEEGREGENAQGRVLVFLSYCNTNIMPWQYIGIELKRNQVSSTTSFNYN